MNQDERTERIHSAEENMNRVLANQASTYTEQAAAIDEFFNTWSD